MYVVWDPIKARKNLKKHKVDFADAGEYRYNTLARSPNSDVLYVVHLEHDEQTVRIISARLAEPGERDQYFSGDFYE